MSENVLENPLLGQAKSSKNFIFDLSPLIKLTEYKNNQSIIRYFYSKFDRNKFERVMSCAKVLILKKLEHTQTKEQKLEIDHFTTCQIRFCAVCVWRRQMKFAKLTYQMLEKIKQLMKVRYIFLTLTIKNPPFGDLKETIKHMQAAFKRMVKTAQWQRSILGYCRVFEITKPKCAKEQGNIHPHFHVLLAVKSSYFSGSDGKYLTKDDYADMWQKALRTDYTPICDVRIIKPKTKDGKTVKDIPAAIAELIKYPMKDTDLKALSLEEFKSLDQQMRRVRAINYGGILKEANKQNIDEVELDESDLEQWREIETIIMEYHSKSRNYLVAYKKNKEQQQEISAEN